MVRKMSCGALASVMALMLSAAFARAAVPAPSLSVSVLTSPTVFSTADTGHCESSLGGYPTLCDQYVVNVRNSGGMSTDGSPVTITSSFPAGLAVKSVQLHWVGVSEPDYGPADCSAVAVSCRFSGVLAPDQVLQMSVNVTVGAGAPQALSGSFTVSGGGAAQGATADFENGNGTALPSFGANAFSAEAFAADGSLETQAGGHPYELGTRVALNGIIRTEDAEGERGEGSVEDLKDVVVDLPPGMVGSALATPTCSLTQLSTPLPNEGAFLNTAGCPETDTRVGYIKTFPKGAGGAVHSGIFNVAPEPGSAAEFGFTDILKGTHVLHVGVAPTPAGYVLRTVSSEIPQVNVNEILVNLYGNPAVRDGSSSTPVALLTNPSACTGEPQVTRLHIDSWQHPGRWLADGEPDLGDPNWKEATSVAPPVTGCDRLHFEGSLTAQPETTQTSTPTGLNVDVHVPQSENPESLVTPPLRDAVVTLPTGLAVNAAAANGLESCSLAQIGLGNGVQPGCPAASKIASVEVETPAVAGVLQGSLYLAAQNENPFHSLLAGYIVVDDPVTGVLLKIPGKIEPNGVTGQIVASFDDAPQFPFSDLKLHFFGGPRAPLVTPASCGSYTTNSVLTPWSAPDSGPPLVSVDSFQITSGCTSGFAPVFAAGTASNQAGGFAPFELSLARNDSEQTVAGVSVTLPQGVLGILKGVEQCPEPQAAQGACGAGSLIGHVAASAGVGPDPVTVQGGQVFLTGPYKGAPFGLSIVVPAVAGPFNLGTVVVRAAIEVNPSTAQIVVVSDPLPTILQGVPLNIRAVNVTIDRAGFAFNPTSCSALTVAGTITSTQGAQAAVSSRFQAAGCQGLPFRPSFKVSTQAKTSKKQGASLDVKVGSGMGQANIAKVAVTLPKQLPARLTTIQQACLAAVFNANPANCPVASNIGVATAVTPVLGVPLTGPAYLVSHGGAAFPDVVVILQGDGVTLDLTGNVDIKHNITSSTFASIPDAPISSFELKLPEGPHSGLAAVVPAKAKGSMCGQALTMPTTLTGQNGAVVKQTTKISVTGCPKTKTKAKKKQKKRGGGK